MTAPKIYKGLDLLDKIFEFTAMTPDESQWNIQYLQHNPPRQIRLRQIRSLSKAFLEKPETKQTFIEKAKSGYF